MRVFAVTAFLSTAFAFMPYRGGLPTLARPVSRSQTVPQMAIAVFGASGGVGGEAAYQALKKGEGVSCLVRDPARLTIPEGSGGSDAEKPMEGCNVVTGTVTSQADVDKVFEGQDITGVVVSLGGKTKDVGGLLLCHVMYH